MRIVMVDCFGSASASRRGGRHGNIIGSEAQHCLAGRQGSGVSGASLAATGAAGSKIQGTRPTPPALPSEAQRRRTWMQHPLLHSLWRPMAAIQSVATFCRCQVLVMSPPGALCTSDIKSMSTSPSSSLRLHVSQRDTAARACQPKQKWVARQQQPSSPRQTQAIGHRSSGYRAAAHCSVHVHAAQHSSHLCRMQGSTASMAAP